MVIHGSQFDNLLYLPINSSPEFRHVHKVEGGISVLTVCIFVFHVLDLAYDDVAVELSMGILVEGVDRLPFIVSHAGEPMLPILLLGARFG